MYALIAAGGRGERLGFPGGKQLIEVAGKPMISYSLSTFESHSDVEGVVVSVDRSIIDEIGKIAKDEGFSKIIAVVEGGQERIDSVEAGLAEVPSDASFIAIHDGARPMVTEALMDRLMNSLISGGFDGVVPALPLKDTIKVAVDDRVLNTLDRSQLFAVQTPQVFKAERLRGAYQRLSASRPSTTFTDDASLVESDGGTIGLVKGDEENIKVTTPLDLRIAEMILRSRR